jgi:hypothetical protein
MKKTTRSIVGLALAGLGIVFYLWFTPGRTPAIHGPNSIASLERIRIGEVDQYILIRGNDSSLPVLLFLHGGPGMPAMYLAHAFQPELEKEFVVVQVGSPCCRKVISRRHQQHTNHRTTCRRHG